MCNRLLGQLLAGQLSHHSEVTLWLVVLYKLSRPTLFFMPFKFGFKWLSYGHLSPGAVVTRAVVPLIGGSFDAS